MRILQKVTDHLLNFPLDGLTMIQEEDASDLDNNTVFFKYWNQNRIIILQFYLKGPSHSDDGDKAFIEKFGPRLRLGCNLDQPGERI